MQQSETDDASLVERAKQRGNAGRSAMDRLVTRHQVWLVKLLLHLLGNQSDAEDVAQEVFVKAMISISGCTRGEGFRPWLRVIARRLAFNYRRESSTRNRYHEQLEYKRPYKVPTPSGGTRKVEDQDVVDHVLAKVPYAYREVMILRYVEEMSVKEVASMLDIGESATKMRLSRARTEFAEAYESLEKPNGRV